MTIEVFQTVGLNDEAWIVRWANDALFYFSIQFTTVFYRSLYLAFLFFAFIRVTQENKKIRSFTVDLGCLGTLVASDVECVERTCILHGRWRTGFKVPKIATKDR